MSVREKSDLPLLPENGRDDCSVSRPEGRERPKREEGEGRGQASVVLYTPPLVGKKRVFDVGWQALWRTCEIQGRRFGGSREEHK